MQRCPNCRHMNRPGVLICEKCGTNLATGKSQTATKALGQKDQEKMAEQDAAVQKAASEKAKSDPVTTDTGETSVRRGTDEFPKGGTLRLEVEGSSKSVQVPLTVHNREIVLGRRDPATGALPDIDLTPFAGYRMGVSRRHGLIRYSEGKYLDLFDQGSSNGTFLNGQRMDAHYPSRLHNGDRIRLGQITIRMHFEPGGGTVSNKSTNDEQGATTPLGTVSPKSSGTDASNGGVSSARRRSAEESTVDLRKSAAPSKKQSEAKPASEVAKPSTPVEKPVTQKSEDKQSSSASGNSDEKTSGKPDKNPDDKKEANPTGTIPQVSDKKASTEESSTENKDKK